MQTAQTLPTSQDELAMKAWSFDHASYPKVITNLDLQIILVNSAFTEIFGFTQEEARGKRSGELLRNRSVGPALEKVIPAALATKGLWRGEVFHTSKVGVERQFLLYIVSIYDPNGKKIGYLGTDFDLTDRKQLELQVAHAEKLSTIGENLATLMHEIRNPLNGISMNAYLLEQVVERGKVLTDDDIESILLISKEAKRLEALVKNGLSYVRKPPVNPLKVFLKGFFEEVRNLVMYQAQQQSIEIKISPVAEDISAFFDPDLMKQVFLNLLKNAIDAALLSPERIVRLGLRIAEEEKWRDVSPSGRVLLFNIDNSGKKIPEETIQNLFKPFFTSKEGGTGLGLVEASKIVRQHHGILNHYDINDAPFFTRFTVILPI